MHILVSLSVFPSLLLVFFTVFPISYLRGISTLGDVEWRDCRALETASAVSWFSDPVGSSETFLLLNFNLLRMAEVMLTCVDIDSRGMQ